jgi:hypothetical protein
MWRGILAAVLIVCAIIGARQFSNAQQDTSGKAQQDTSSNEEVEICRGKNSSTYEADGKRYSLPFDVVDDQAIVEGDIVLGSTADAPRGGASYAPIVPDYVRGQPKRWGNGVAPYVVPYVIDNSVRPSDRALIQRAMSEWTGRTSMRFQQLSGTRDWRRENYVKFSGQKNQCSSNSLGIKERLSGSVNEEDNINVVEVAGCGQNWGRIAHEIGHVLGLGHEHSRGDRDDYITILWSNIDRPKQFCRAIWDQQTLVNTAYDFDSIMHYSPYQAVKASSDCQTVIYQGKSRCLAFVPIPEKLQQQQQLLPPNITLEVGQRDHLSEGDIGLVNMLYPAAPGIVQLTKPDQTCAITTTTTIKVGDRTTTTTKTGPCPTSDQQTIILPPPPDRDRCCHVQRPRRPICRPGVCGPIVRVSWPPRPDRWCRPGWCRPRPRRLCGDWIENGWRRPPFDDGDDDWW